MREKILHLLISAFVGGFVAIAIVFWHTPKTPRFDKLEVGTLVVTDQLSMRDRNATDDEILMKSGSIMLQNKVVASQFLGTQMAASVFVGNRMYTTPNNLFATPISEWKFFTELGSDPQCGGELLVRSSKGGSGVRAEINEGLYLKMGFDAQENLMVFAQNNASSIPLPIVRRQPPGPNETELSRPSFRNWLEQAGRREEQKQETTSETKENHERPFERRPWIRSQPATSETAPETASTTTPETVATENAPAFTADAPLLLPPNTTTPAVASPFGFPAVSPPQTAWGTDDPSR